MSRSTLYDHAASRSRAAQTPVRGVRLRKTLHRGLHFEPLESRRLLAIFEGIPEWAPIGPAPIDLSIGSANDNVRLLTNAGAIGAIAVHPTNPNVLYVGSVNGGVWKTDNATYSRGDGIDNDSDGKIDLLDNNEIPHWTPLTDDFSTSISALTFDPIDATNETLWAGNARFSSLGREGVPRGGLLRTTNGGDTWTELGRTTFQNINVESIVPTELMTPTGQLVLVATSDGVWRTANGGQTWTRVLNGNVTGLVRDPMAADRFLAAVVGQGIFRSASGQANHSDSATVWNTVNNDSNMVAKITGAARIGLAATTAGTGAVFAATVADGITGVFETNNSGTMWDEIDVPTGRTGIAGANAGFRHFAISADPVNQHRVYVSGFRTVAVGDGLTDTWSLLDPLGDPGNPGPWQQVLNTNGFLHDDVRGLVVDLNGNLLMSNDGGIFRINKPFNNSQRYSESINGDLQITETNSLFSLAYDSLNDVVVLGTQDNGTVIQTSGASLTYREWTGGDGNSSAVEVDTTNQVSYRYVADNNWKSLQRLKYDANNQPVGNPVNLELAASLGAARYSGLTRGNDAKVSSNAYSPGFPLVLNAVTPSRLILGTGSGLYESMNRGDTVVDITPGGVNRRVTAVAYGGWQSGIANADIMYVGADAQLWLRTSAATGFGQPLTSYVGSTPIDIVLDPLNWQEAYVLDSSSRIWRTTNAGGVWTDLTLGAGLPPLESIDFARIGGIPVLLAGGEGGVFRRLDPASALDWSEVGRGLPNVIVKDVLYDETDKVLLAGTVGRGVWKIDNAADCLPFTSTLTVSGDLTDHGDATFPNRPDIIRVAQNATHDSWIDIFDNHIGGAPEYSVKHAAVESIVINAKGGGDFVQVDYLPPRTRLEIHGGDGRDVFYVATSNVHSVVALFGDADADWFRVTPNTNAEVFISGGTPAAPVQQGDALSVVTAGLPFTDHPGPQSGDGYVSGAGFKPVNYFQTEEVFLGGPHWRQDIWEPNDTLATAADLIAGSQIENHLTIHEPGNSDWFKWTATNGNGNLFIDLSFQHALGDLDLALYDASQSLLTSSTTVSDEEYVVWSAMQGQTYYIRVYGYNNATNPDYTLDINWPLGFPDDSLEQNDTFGQAYNLGLGDQSHKNLAITPTPGGEFVSDDDWYRWRASADGILTVDAKFLHALGNLNLELRDSSQVLLAASTSTDDNERVTALVVGGRNYYIHVYGFAGATNPNYELIINGPGIPPDPYDGTGNNSAKKATDIGAGDVHITNLSIHQPGDDDWFVWRADANNSLKVDIAFEHDLGDLDLELLDANLVRLGRSQTTSDSEQVAHDVQAGQSYYIRVYGFGGATNFDYTLDITWPPGILSDAFEPNDTFAAAYYLGKGDQVRENLTIHPVGEFQSSDDWYRWRASTDGVLDVSVLFLDAPGDIDLALYNASQTLLTSSTSSTDNEAVRWQVQAAQDYYIRVWGFNGARNADYDLFIDGPDIVQDLFEPNNSRSDAYNIGMGDQTHAGLTLHAPGNDDWYLWTAPVSGTLAVDAEFTHALGDIDLQLYDAMGGLLKSSTSTGNGEHVAQTVVAGEQYYILVYGFADATNPSYELKIDGPNVLPDDREPNDSLDSAALLSEGNQTLVNLTIHEPGNSDWFKWIAPDDGTLTVETAFAHQLGDLDLELYDGQGNLLESSVSMTNLEQVSSSVAAGQVYYVRVFGPSAQYFPKMLRGTSIVIQSGALSDNYTLSVAFVATPELAGDYKVDGVVDAADYVIWRHTLGSTTDLRADGNGNGVVDQPDYGVWRANFGRVAPSPAAAAANGTEAPFSESESVSAGMGEVTPTLALESSSEKSRLAAARRFSGLMFEAVGRMPIRGVDMARSLTTFVQLGFRDSNSRAAQSPALVSPRVALYVDRLLDQDIPGDDEDAADRSLPKMYDKDSSELDIELRDRAFEQAENLEDFGLTV